MRADQINRVSSAALIALSLLALLMVLSGALLAVLSGYNPFREADEGAAAHIFQLAIVALVPMTLVFLATADWTRPVRRLQSLAYPAAAVGMAFGVLYYFDHLARF